MSLDAQGQFLLFPVTDALPAIQAYLAAQPEDGSSLSAEELQALARFFTRVIETSELLVNYAIQLAGRPHRN